MILEITYENQKGFTTQLGPEPNKLKRRKSTREGNIDSTRK
jgi:hypothetical protein